jgi:DNA transformation protein and related proteins
MPPRKTADDTFTTFVIEQLRGLGPVEARSMFGGKGLYWKDQIFGLIDDGRLYFRVAESTVGDFESAGTKPFEPWPGHVMKGYYEVPARVLEDGEEAAAWARAAWSHPRGRARKAASGGRVKRPAARPAARKPSAARPAKKR